MKKTSIVFFLFTAIFTFSQQKTQKEDLTEQKTYNFWNNVRFGGGLGLDFSNGGTSILLSPTIIYDFNNQFSAGISAGYQYSSRENFSSNTFSIGALALYSPFQNFQLSAEFEQLFINQKVNNQNFNRKIPALYLGAAYIIGRNFSLGIRYDVIYDENKSPYSSAFSPIVRVFF